MKATALKRAPNPADVVRPDERPSIDQVIMTISEVAGKVGARVRGDEAEARRVSHGLYSYLRRCEPFLRSKLISIWERQPGDFIAAVMHVVELRVPLGAPNTWALVPYYRKRAGRYDLTPIVMVSGVRILAERKGYAEVRVHLVREDEHFVEHYGTEPSIEYTPRRPQDESADVKAALVTWVKDGKRGSHVVDGARLRRVQRFAERRGSDAWKNWRPEMLKKTAMHAWFRTLPRTFGEREEEALEALEVGEAGHHRVAPHIRRALEAEAFDVAPDEPPDEVEEEPASEDTVD